MPQIDSWQKPEESWKLTHFEAAPFEAAPADAPIPELRPRDRRGDPLSELLPEPLSGLIHDARNMVSALELYCDLLEEPGVLSDSYRHYAGELRRVGAANRRLLEGLSQLDPPVDSLSGFLSDSVSQSLSVSPPAGRAFPAAASAARLRSRWQRDRLPTQLSTSPVRLEAVPGSAPGPAPASLARSGSRQAFSAGQRVENLAAELHANHNLLAAMAGHAVTLGMTIRGGGYPVAMSGDDLTRVLVNLARNAAEAMPDGGHLQIDLEEGPEYLTLSFTDNGPGIPEEALESIFSPGYSTQIGLQLERYAAVNAWPRQHRGLGLSIVRSLVGAAGGAVWAANRIAEKGSDPAQLRSTRGAVFLIEFPFSKAGRSFGKQV